MPSVCARVRALSTHSDVVVVAVARCRYVDTRYGHQAPVHAIDSLVRERAVTCGADRTVRLWKVVDDSQLVFRANTTAPCLDCVAMVRMPPPLPVHVNQPHHHLSALRVRLSASTTPPHSVVGVSGAAAGGREALCDGLAGGRVGAVVRRPQEADGVRAHSPWRRRYVYALVSAPGR